MSPALPCPTGNDWGQHQGPCGGIREETVPHLPGPHLSGLLSCHLCPKGSDFAHTFEEFPVTCKRLIVWVRSQLRECQGHLNTTDFQFWKDTGGRRVPMSPSDGRSRPVPQEQSRVRGTSSGCPPGCPCLFN